jgi:hypothetical protein
MGCSIILRWSNLFRDWLIMAMPPATHHHAWSEHWAFLMLVVRRILMKISHV